MHRTQCLIDTVVELFTCFDLTSQVHWLARRGNKSLKSLVDLCVLELTEHVLRLKQKVDVFCESIADRVNLRFDLDEF